MLICYDYQIFSLQKVGGISRYFVELAERLARYDDGIETTVIAPLHINEYLSRSSVKKIDKKFFAFPGKHHFLPQVNRRITARILKKLQPDIFHETYYSNFLQEVNAPRVLTVYDMIHELYPEQFDGLEKKIPEYKAAAVSRADHIIAISQNTRADVISYLGIPENKISVIPLASSLEEASLSFSCNCKKWDKPYLLYVGLRQGVKNFSTLLMAYRRSKILPQGYDLLCVGGGPFTHQESSVIEHSGLKKKIHQLQADDMHLKMLYSNATVFVYPSLYEGFGLPLLEAMKCGCPVVCSNTSSMPEIAGDAACYFNPADEEELRTVLERMVLSETEQEYYLQRGYEREKKFSWSACVEKTAQLYRSLQ